MIGLRAFNIVLVGKGFPVEQVNAEEFSFNGAIPKTTVKVPQAILAGVDEYTIQLFPERFQVQATTAKATQYRTQAVIDVAKHFVDEFVAKRSVTAIGHNFSGSFASPRGDGAAFMQFLAWPDGLNEALAPAAPPSLSWSARYQMSDDTDEPVVLVRLEPSTDDPSRVFYDMNLSWGDPNAPIHPPLVELLDRLPRSAEYASTIVDRLAALKA